MTEALESNCCSAPAALTALLKRIAVKIPDKSKGPAMQDFMPSQARPASLGRQEQTNCGPCGAGSLIAPESSLSSWRVWSGLEFGSEVFDAGRMSQEFSGLV